MPRELIGFFLLVVGFWGRFMPPFDSHGFLARSGVLLARRVLFHTFIAVLPHLQFRKLLLAMQE
ncbi:hypothetical protein ACLPHM_05960 [Paenalcaligenes sp. Me131]|uniref:hypothetical protein n=1 Tax=Paenalcaligenes sp. Me131 TaxID=3392636 RepID=UPI003D2DADA9